MEVVRPNIYADTDSLKVADISSSKNTARLTSLEKSYIAHHDIIAKSIFNSMYGVQVMNKLCNRPYIVVHAIDAFNDNAIFLAIVFIDSIVAVMQNSEHKCILHVYGGARIITDDLYTDIVRKLFKD